MKPILNFLYISILIVALASCSEDDDDSASLAVMEMPQSEAISLTSVIDSGGYVYEYSLKLDKATSSNFIFKVKVDEDLVDEYNKNNSTSYEMMPSTLYSLTRVDGVIKEGELESNTLSVAFNAVYGLDSGAVYLLPVVAVPEGSSVDLVETTEQAVSYFIFKVDGNFDNISGLDMSTYSSAMYTSLYFPDDEVVTIDENTHTFEVLVYPYNWHSGTTYIGSWKGKDLNNNNESFRGCELRVSGTAGATAIGNRQCDLTKASSNVTLPANQWSLITVTCDGTQTGQSSEVAYRLYINGELVASAAPTKRYGSSSKQGFKVGYTINGMQFGYPSSSYYFDGLISEIRMWKGCLTEDEIKANLREVQSPSSDKMYGYWKLNEGSGNILYDSSGNGRNMEFSESSTVVWGAAINNLPTK